jgi:coenzyme F420-reducing hydrogenase delta subunit
MILAAFRNGADGVWISGCHPGDCHYIEGNYYARRKFALFRTLFKHIGIDERRLHFSWISAAEGPKFATVANEVVDAVKEVGPAQQLVKTKAQVG